MTAAETNAVLVNHRLALRWRIRRLVPITRRRAILLVKHLGATQPECESCGQPPDVLLITDGSQWCHDCNDNARILGYEDEERGGTEAMQLIPGGLAANTERPEA